MQHPYTSQLEIILPYICSAIHNLDFIKNISISFTLSIIVISLMLAISAISVILLIFVISVMSFMLVISLVLTMPAILVILCDISDTCYVSDIDIDLMKIYVKLNSL